MGMSQSRQAILLFTNDDGIESPGLWAAVRAFKGAGRLLVVAPREQQSGMGRSLPHVSEGRIYPYEPPADCGDCRAYAVDGSPAQAVQHAVLELADDKPALLVSGINYGENTGNGVTISGTVGAALEGASLGIPSIAVSQQTPTDLHLTYSSAVDFRAAAAFALKFGLWLMRPAALPDDVDLLKIDVPWGATAATEWRWTRVSRRRVYVPVRPQRIALKGRGKLGYRYDSQLNDAEPNSDVYAVLHDKVVSVTPMSLDMTARTDFYRLSRRIAGESGE